MQYLSLRLVQNIGQVNPGCWGKVKAASLALVGISAAGVLRGLFGWP
jgi:hypothetical protein